MTDNHNFICSHRNVVIMEYVFMLNLVGNIPTGSVIEHFDYALRRCTYTCA